MKIILVILGCLAAINHWLVHRTSNLRSESKSVATIALPEGVKAVTLAAGGGSHVCVILQGGSVRCWGDGRDGALGYGNTNDVGDDETPGDVSPVFIGAGRTATAISAGSNHTCVIRDDGSVLCWGSGEEGRLGTGNTSDIGKTNRPGDTTPVSIGAGRSAIAISAAESTTCVVLDDGSIRCWGLYSPRFLGLPIGQIIGDNEAPSSVAAVKFPGISATAVGVGMTHVCALFNDGTVRCWGRGNEGSLGYGNTNDIGDDEPPTSATAVDLGGRSATRIAVGGHISCALLDDATVRCWGWDWQGVLGYGLDPSTGATIYAPDLASGAGYGRIGDNELPTAVRSLNFSGQPITAIFASSSHTCAIGADGGLRCWGWGAWGKLGYGNIANVGMTNIAGATGSVNVGIGRTVVSVALSHHNTCAILDNGTVKCWGHGGPILGTMRLRDVHVGDDETPQDIAPINFIPRPAPPSNLTATSGSSSVNLAWNDNSSDETSFVVQRRPFGGTAFAFVGTRAANTTTFVDASVANGSSYDYRVAAVNAGGTSSYSNIATGAPRPVTVIALTLPPTSNNGNYTLGWSCSGLCSSFYQIEESSDLTFTSPTGYGTGELYYTFAGKPVGTYCYRVSANGGTSWSDPKCIQVLTPAGPATVSLNATADNTLFVSNFETSMANTTYDRGGIAVGCNFTVSYNPDFGPITTYFCTASALKFDVESALLGRTVTRAVLRLWPDILPADTATTYAINAFAAPWSANSITWTNQPNYYTFYSAQVSPPTTTAVPVEFDVTNIVQSWANETWNNNGFLISDTSNSLPGDTAYRLTQFQSMDYYLNASQRPQLILELQ